jgi:hypothetical protein
MQVSLLTRARKVFDHISESIVGIYPDCLLEVGFGFLYLIFLEKVRLR